MLDLAAAGVLEVQLLALCWLLLQPSPLLLT
jgi:hypothetical protein